MRTWLQWRPIIAALRRHKAAVVLVLLEIALTLAVLANLVFIVTSTIERSRLPTGVMEGDIGVIQSIGVIGEDNPGTAGSNLALLSQVAGVASAAYGGPPLYGAQSTKVFQDAARQKMLGHAYEFVGSQGLSRTLGVKIVDGRDFGPTDPPDATEWGKVTEAPALITRALADHLFPEGQAVGARFFDGTSALRVIGVVDHLRGEITGRASDDYGIVVEYQLGPQDVGGGYVIRSQPGRLEPTLRAAAAAMANANPGHVQNDVLTMRELRERYFSSDLAAGRMLIAIMAILVIVTALGITGLASFWVQKRRRQIGMRRALGATRRDILHYFQIENALIVSVGIVLGALLAYALNLFLMRRFELPHLPGGYLLLGAITLWLIGQLAVLGPAMRAASVPPVVATRSA